MRYEIGVLAEKSFCAAYMPTSSRITHHYETIDGKRFPLDSFLDYKNLFSLRFIEIGLLIS